MATHLVISGRVQGIGYRYSMCVEARRLGVAGWVRNRADGRVEAVIEGSPQWVQAMLDWAHRGPPGARVDHIARSEIPDTGLAGFEQRSTA